MFLENLGLISKTLNKKIPSYTNNNVFSNSKTLDTYIFEFTL